MGGEQDLYLFSDMAEKELNTFSDGDCVSNLMFYAQSTSYIRARESVREPNSKTFFYKDCSLCSVKSCQTNSHLAKK